MSSAYEPRDDPHYGIRAYCDSLKITFGQTELFAIYMPGSGFRVFSDVNGGEYQSVLTRQDFRNIIAVAMLALTLPLDESE